MIARSARPLGFVLAALGLGVALAGCSFNLFPKATPEQLYRFGGSAQSPAAGAMSARHGVLDDTITFNREASSDRILTVTGDEVAYVKGGRWAAAAPVLFREAVQRAFQDAAGPDRLVERGEPAKIDYVLRLDVRRFEARYEGGQGAAPTILVRVRAAVSRYADRTLIGERTFEASVPASDNRIGAMAQAFDQATEKVLAELVNWVGETAA